MIEEMRIRDLGVIAEAAVEFAAGLTVLSGETGAGKTMVLTGLALLCGGRADPARVRGGCARAVVEGRVRLPADHPALREAIDAGAELDEDGTLLLVRIVAADGRSRAVVGGRTVPSGTLARIMADVVAVHGQSAQAGLLRPAAAREALDRFAGLAGPAGDGTFERYEEAYRTWRAAERELADRLRHARERAQEADLLRLGLGEIEKVAPEPDELADLVRTAEVLSHAEELRGAADAARRALAADESGDTPVDALSLLIAAHRVLAGSAGHDAGIRDLAERAREVAALAADLAADLAAYSDRVESDPARLASVEERRSRIRHLTRRYGDSVAEVLDWAAAARARLADLDDSEDAWAALRHDAQQREATARALAEELHRRRLAAADELGTAVAAELATLSLGAARLSVAVSRRGAAGDLIHPADVATHPARQDRPVLTATGTTAHLGPDGGDEVALLLSTSPSAPPRPLARVASGGELSRVMLALEVVFAGVTGTPVLVFDEVDAGVGGAVAGEVGRRLARLSAAHQVVTVTHLAQVAAYAQRHLVVRKDEDGAVTTSDVRTLDGVDRVAEVARMLGGLPDSGPGRQHAEELLALAGGGGAHA